MLTPGQELQAGLLALGLFALALPMLDGFRGYYGEAGRLLATIALAMLLGLAATIPIDFSSQRSCSVGSPNVQGDRRCAASSRGVQRAKRTGSTAGLGTSDEHALG